MDDIINRIIEKNSSLFGMDPVIEKINIGFTNTIYNINDSYIVKICTDLNNEESFKKEIYFYNSNKDNKLIPKLYYSNTDKIDIPYYYEIMEKIDGVSLYEVWHTFNEEKREDIIKQLCLIMKDIHNNHSNKYDWIKYHQDKFNYLFEKVKDIFNEEEQEILKTAYNKFSNYLNSDDFVLIHNDLHFDNIFYNDGKIKLIDFERSMYAPRDYELDILYRMIRKPWKFASEKSEVNVRYEDYLHIMNYINKYYPELTNIKNLDKRLAIYDINYYLEQLLEYPKLNELKEDILNATKILVNN